MSEEDKPVENSVDETTPSSEENKVNTESIMESAKENAEKPVTESQMPPADFLHFVSGIAMQALMQLGEMENPFEGKKTTDLAAARYSIDLMQMLSEKTEGNLTDEEKKYIGAALNDLRMRYVAKAKAE